MKLQSRPLIEEVEAEFTIDDVMDVTSQCMMFQPRPASKLIVETSLKTMEMLDKIYDYSVTTTAGGLEVFVQMKRHETFYVFQISC